MKEATIYAVRVIPSMEKSDTDSKRVQRAFKDSSIKRINFVGKFELDRPIMVPWIHGTPPELNFDEADIIINKEYIAPEDAIKCFSKKLEDK